MFIMDKIEHGRAGEVRHRTRQGYEWTTGENERAKHIKSFQFLAETVSLKAPEFTYLTKLTSSLKVVRNKV